MRRRGFGEGSIYKRKDGYWTATISLEWDGRGRHRKTVYGKTRQEVAAKLTPLLRAQQQGLSLASERLTVAAYLDKWLKDAAATVRANTHRRYAQLVRTYIVPRLGRISLAKLAPQECAACFAAMLEGGSAPRSVIAARVVLGRALREAETAGLVARNVVRLTRPPRAPHVEMKTLDAAQARGLLRAVEGDRLAALYQVALASGARQGELLGLRWADVDFEAGLIRIRRSVVRGRGGPSFAEPKTASSRRSIPLGTTALDALRRHRVAQAAERLRAGPAWQDGDLVFPSLFGTPLDPSNLLQNTHYPALLRAGLPRVNFHALRHTHATLALASGLHAKVVAERLGHSTVNVTLNVYSHVTATMQREAAATFDRLLGAS